LRGRRQLRQAGHSIRMVTHLDIDDDAVARVVEAMAAFFGS
jgi:Arc/MetJ family transcription regulator